MSSGIKIKPNEFEIKLKEIQPDLKLISTFARK